ncbi:MAG TPA: aminotransferase class III-fold pyridoxal phosphate-dependent enzyme, partial [Chthoniobacteraceae bacterium]
AVVSQVAPAPEADALATLKRLLSELSGVDLADAPSSTGLLELGFDSLFLSQTAVSLSRKFGVKISLRQLLKELGTLEALAAHIATGRPHAAAPVPASAPMVAASRPPHSSAHGPFRALQRELAVTLTDAQQRWLADFITRYTARTAASKRYTQEHRRHFADPRAVAGFKQVWKEMVYPIVSERSSGARLWDVDGNEWNDVILSFGAAIFGHRADFIVEAISAQLQRGMEIGPTSPLAGEVAARLCRIVGMERAAFCNTGSEAMLGASRIARTVTGRPRIAYFSGSYHGIENEVLGRAGPRGPMPIAPGIPPEALANALILDYDDPRSLERLAAAADEIAAVFVEPVQSRRPALQPREFLAALRELTAKQGIALVFDEIITGFRCHPGGAQAHFGVRADIALYGKVIGGGLPIGAIAGRAEYLDALDGGAWEFGDDSFPGASMTFFAGTFVRHPLALAAARAVLARIEEQGTALQEGLAASAARLLEGANSALAGSPFAVDRFASLWLPRASADFAFPGLLYALLRHRGIHIWENRPCFLSTAHTTEQVDQIVRAFAESAAELEDAGFFSRNAGTRAATPQSIPTTEPQREVWLLSQQSSAASRACILDWTMLLDGPLDVPALQSAIQSVVDRHEALRSTFAGSGEMMIVAPALKISVPLTDLSSQSAEQRDERFAALRRAAGARVFDLENGPLVAIEIVRLEPEKHALVFSAHHIACDGWSCDVFLLELSDIYSGQREGRSNQLPAAMPFREYQAWEAALHDTPEFAADTDYWLGAYRTLPPSLELPCVHQRPARQSFRGASMEARFPAPIPQDLQRLGAQHGATLFTVLFAGFKTLLARLSDQNDLVVGIPAAGQNLVGGEHLIGHCVNLLPVRSKLDGVSSFAGLLSALQVRVLEAFEHQRVTFGGLLQKLSVPRQAGRVPLVSAIFNLDPPLSQMRFADLEHRLEANPRQTFQFDLGVNCDLVADGLRVIFTYNRDLFDESTIRPWMDFYRQILEAAITDSARPLAEFSASAPAENAKPNACAELERLLRAEPGVGECIVVEDGKQLTAWVEAADLTPVELWPSSPSAGAGFIYDDVLYNAMALDKSRHDAYRRAFHQLVKDKVVVDVGTGRDALLARMCIEAGAKKVYAIEILQRPAEQAKALVESLGLADRIVVLHGKSQDVALDERADVCVSENVGHIGGAEGCDVILDDARRRFLKPNGIVIPGRCTTRIAAVSLPAEFRQKPVFETLGAYYARQTWDNVGFPHDLRLCLTGTSRKMLSSTDDLFEDVDFSQPAIPSYEREIVLTVTRD